MDRAKALLVDVGLESLMTAKPNELSGGELRRMAIARAMLMRPGILLADEPTAGLDNENTLAVLGLLRKAADDGAGVLLVTHENEAAQFADEVYVMDGGKLSTQRGGIIMGKKPVRLYVELFLTFLKVGLFTFGGGYAMIPIIEHTCVEQKRWITHDEMMDVTVMAESTPGPIAINCATYVGYKQAKMPGAITATLGIVLPSMLIIMAVALFLDNLLEIPIVASAFKGIKLAVGVLIFDAGLGMLKKMKKPRARVIAGVACAAMLVINLLSLRISSIVLMLIAAVFGAIMYAAHKKGGTNA